MKGVKLEYKTEINALLEAEEFFYKGKNRYTFRRNVYNEDYIYSSFILMETRDAFLNNKQVYCDMFRILKEVNIDGNYYILTMNINVVDGKLLSASYDLIDGNLGRLELPDGVVGVVEKLFKALNIFFNTVVRINRAMVDGNPHIEDYTNFFKSLDTITYISTNTEFFQG
jgi:hypothetical protein